ncbi:hypothetical protein PXD04_10190 [Methanosphaera sp. ISO3-F5]|uniref:hypothetical protein n=1 Tax=Methanosphaera sp. ISO3-F5 TaxID=1452353 RepID=UPI002B26289E|nr:hypothetical protein [Methanosphaera sp. ISO3-F5]WQH64059.1 hypothetical protein PXD04_10190 [Methanosphaera sp. ISO3-F5]
MIEEKEIPPEIMKRKCDIEILKTIQALLIDRGYMDTAKKLGGVIMSYNRLIGKYYHLKYEEGKQ